MGISLSNVLLRDVNAERSDAFRVRIGAFGLVRIPKSEDIVAHLVLSGRIAIEVKAMGGPLWLERGEFALLFYGTRHRIYVDARPPAGKGTQLPAWPSGDEPAEIKVGQGAAKATVLSAALRLIYNPTRAHGENPLDEVFRLGTDAAELFKGRVLLTDMTQVEAASHGPGASAFVNALMNMHLTHAIRCGSMHLEYGFRDLSHNPYLMGSAKTRAIATAVRLLRVHPEREWTVASLAREVGLSRSAFAAMFRASAGCGPMHLLNKVRMERGAELLAQQRLELPLLTVATRVGYSAASSFARAFKSYYGMSPRAFCKRQRHSSAAA